jgi:beta-lactamase class A
MFTAVLATGVVMKLSADAELDLLDTQDRMVRAVALPAASGPLIQSQKLQSQLGALIAKHSDMRISISYKDIKSHRSFQYGAKGVYTAASVGKLITASLLLSQVDAGQRSLSDPVGGSTARQQLKAMIEVSDNTAWLNLNILLGYDKLEAYAKKVGITDYDSKENLLSAEDIAMLLQKLYSNQLLSKTSTDLLLGHMKVANYRQYIVAAVPDKSTVYHKVGFLEDRLHDAAIINNGKYPYVLVIFTEAKSGIYDFNEGIDLIQNIVETAHKPYLRAKP